MKTCSKCKKLLSFSSFHKNAAMCDGLDHYCRLCRNAFKRRFYIKHRKEIRANYSKYRKSSAGLEAAKRDRTKHPLQIVSRRRIRDALSRGEIIKPLHCQNCQEFAYVESHHYKGYAAEYALDVVWLCRKCHVLAEKLKVS